LNQEKEVNQFWAEPVIIPAPTPPQSSVTCASLSSMATWDRAAAFARELDECTQTQLSIGKRPF